MPVLSLTSAGKDVNGSFFDGRQIIRTSIHAGNRIFGESDGGAVDFCDTADIRRAMTIECECLMVAAVDSRDLVFCKIQALVSDRAIMQRGR